MTKEDDIALLKRKFSARLERELGNEVNTQEISPVKSIEYQQFKKELIPANLTRYEKMCEFSEKLLKIKPDKTKAAELEENIKISHLNITPTGSASFAILMPLAIMLFGSLISYVLLNSFFFVFLFMVIGASLINPLAKMPAFIANSWRMKASNQMVLCVFYIVTYMRHTPNLEGAIQFASEHLAPPLNLDLKKVLWDVETEEYESVVNSLEAYLESWKKYNQEFIEAFHLIESSLYEGDEEKRLATLDKSLDVILSETYEKMLHYAQNLQSPITMLHMLGVILPILGLVILPLVVSFLGDVKWFHLAAMYNIVLPLAVYYLGKSILSKRPSGYGDEDITEQNPELKKFQFWDIKFGGKTYQVNPIYLALLVGSILFLIGMLPIIIHVVSPGFDFNLDPDGKFQFLGYRESLNNPNIILGPFGLGASIISIFITLAFGLSAGLYFKTKSKRIMDVKNKSTQLENEFVSALFQLGNRLGDGVPAEMAVEKVAKSMEGTISGKFFEVVNNNIRRLGMSVEDAIFNKKYGALVRFPSKIIESSMKVLTESIKKGPSIAAEALLNVSRYVKEIHKVNERLKDLMAEIISSMNSQIKFLTPAIAGIVVGITSMVTTILGNLSIQMKNMEGGGSALPQLFGDGIPSFYFQIIVGLYVVQISYILTIIANGIENGADKLGEMNSLAKNMVRSTFLYSFIALSIIIAFNFIAATIMDTGMLGG
ncbi:MAG: hypothetical protein KJ601_04925 [Nanoarchaeota archaeon]|nr:hypothetical protein [Nanoarchaeota archaeon]